MIIRNLPTWLDPGGLHAIEGKIRDWNMEPLYGRGIFTKYTGGDMYAHVELKLYVSEERQLRWNLPEWPAGALEYRDRILGAIEGATGFFADHLSVLRGTKTKVTFEITDCSFHLADFRFPQRSYGQATIMAITDCFDKGIHPFDRKIRRDPGYFPNDPSA